MTKIKTIFAIGAVSLATLGLTACDETYDAVNGTDQVLVRDAGDKVGPKDFKAACDKQHKTLVDVQYVGNGRLSALVTCR